MVAPPQRMLLGSSGLSDFDKAVQVLIHNGELVGRLR